MKKFSKASALILSKGFTLVELLVVIAIIAVLSTVVSISVSGNQKKARDARVLSDLSQIKKQLDLYRVEKGNFVGAAAAPGISNSNCLPGTKSCVVLSDDSNTIKVEIGRMASDIKVSYGSDITYVNIYSGGAKAVVIGRLPSNNKYACYDSQGQMKTYGSNWDDPSTTDNAHAAWSDASCGNF